MVPSVTAANGSAGGGIILPPGGGSYAPGSTDPLADGSVADPAAADPAAGGDQPPKAAGAPQAGADLNWRAPRHLSPLRLGLIGLGALVAVGTAVVVGRRLYLSSRRRRCGARGLHRSDRMTITEGHQMTEPAGSGDTRTVTLAPVEAGPTSTLLVDALPQPAPSFAPASLAELRARSISAWFGAHQVLDRVSLTMPAGVVTSLIGPSGCGKSTFLRILNRMHELVPSAALAGEVLLDGEDIYDPSRRLTQARRHIGMVFQKPNPFPAMSIRDNVARRASSSPACKASASEKDELVEQSLTKAGLWRRSATGSPRPAAGCPAASSSVCASRARSRSGPRVLLMDEPCSALDPTSTRVIEETMTRARARGDDRHRHAQHAAGRAGLAAVRVLPRRAGHARRDRRARGHARHVPVAAGRAHRGVRRAAASAECPRCVCVPLLRVPMLPANG